MAKIEIDQDILNSLYVFYFGSTNDKYVAAINKAYRDFSRTIDFKHMVIKDNQNIDDVKYELRESVVNLLKKEISYLINDENINKETFNNRHNNICNKIIDVYKKNDITIHYGQAQKWLNMSFKYLFCLQEGDFKNIFHFLHIPIDKNIIAAAYKIFNIEKPKRAWSKLDKEEYINYQEKLVKSIGNQIDPLRWEIKAFIDAKNLK